MHSPSQLHVVEGDALLPVAFLAACISQEALLVAHSILMEGLPCTGNEQQCWLQFSVDEWRCLPAVRSFEFAGAANTHFMNLDQPDLNPYPQPQHAPGERQPVQQGRWWDVHQSPGPQAGGTHRGDVSD